MTAIITREEAVLILGTERELTKRIEKQVTGELARLITGAKLFFRLHRTGNPVFEIRGNLSDDDRDVIETIETIKRGEAYKLLCGGR